jgi:hypothetical protein
MLMWVKGPYVNVSVRTLMLLEAQLMILAYAYIYCDVKECVVCLIYSSFTRRISMYMSLHEKEHMHITNAWLHVFMLDVMVA